MRFSERYGYKSVREIIQKESIDDALKNKLWSLVHNFFLHSYGNFINQDELTNHSILKELIHAFWFKIFDQPTDTIPSKTIHSIAKIRSYFFDLQWFNIYDFIEEIIKFNPKPEEEKSISLKILLFFGDQTTNYYSLVIEGKNIFIQELKDLLQNENLPYRIIKNQFVQITSEQEIQSIEEALENTSPYSGVQQHLNQALKLMSDRQNPDYRNSIKESISAVESICKIVTNDDKATLGKALKIVEDKFGLHPALKGSLSQLYGYTSDGDGIRHAMIEESNLSYIDAKFMLVACTNFINYLIEKTK